MICLLLNFQGQKFCLIGQGDKKLRLCTRCHAAIFVSFVTLAATVSFAQTDTGSIAGYAKNPSGRVIPKAGVRRRGALCRTRPCGADSMQVPA